MADHGTIACYRNGCRQPECAQAKTRYNTRRDLLKASGRWQPYVDAEPARQHVQHLRANGLGKNRIAHLAGVSTSTLQHLTTGNPTSGRPPTTRLRPDIAAAILAIQPSLNNLGDSTLVDATGTRRRSQALAFLGWSQAEQARRLGIDHRTYTGINTNPQVIAATARAVRALYDELSMTPAPASRNATYARNLAKKNGYAPPLAWDDDTIDDPNARPDLGETVPRITAHLENLNELEALGCEPEEIAARLGVGRDYLPELRRRARLREVAA